MNVFPKYGNLSVTIDSLMGELCMWSLKVAEPELPSRIDWDDSEAKTIKYLLFLSLSGACFVSLSPDNKKSWQWSLTSDSREVPDQQFSTLLFL